MDIIITDKEREPLIETVWNECQRIYDLDYRANRELPMFDLPWTTCTTCGATHRCVVSVVDMSAECCECRFRRRMAEEEQTLIDSKLAYRKEQLKDFANI
jgi:hypothetical protein